MNMMTASRRFVPVTVDRFQASAYTLVAYTLYTDGSLMAQFADGTERPSIYHTVAALLAAGQADHLERVREV